jgi:hypothetical protein
VHASFCNHGPDISYTTRLTGDRGPGITTYAALMTQVDAGGRELSFLASEEAFRVVKDLQRRNLVVPVVGNFAGPTSIRAIGDYLEAHDEAVTAFYVSNVEEYLGTAPIPPNGVWSEFCANVTALPLTSSSVFIRPWGTVVFSTGGALTLARSVTITTPDAGATVHPPGHRVALPSALMPILAEVPACRRVNAGTHLR